MLFFRCLPFISLVICVSVDYPPASPCGQYFKYNFDNVWTGQVSIPVSKNDLPVATKVSMRLKGTLQTKYAGLIELTLPPEITLDNIVNKNSKIVNYTVRFPLPWPLPMLKSIEVNNVTLCSSSIREMDDLIVTDIVLQHTFPTNRINLHFGGTNHKVTKWREMCVRSSSNVLHGSPDEWPWLAAILVQNPFGLEFICSGNLITDRHVLTAAHCVENYSYEACSADDVFVYLGKHDLNKWGEPSSQIRKSKKINIHREFVSDTYNADIAIITLEIPAVINNVVRPICLWSGDTDLHPILGLPGMIAGWGKNLYTGRISSQPRQFFLPVVDQNECLRSRKDYFYITSERTLCAGVRNGTGPCNGDSGSGLLVSRLNKNNEIVWELRGILSLSLLDPFKQSCDLSNYLVFTDAAKFLGWIKGIFEDERFQ